MRHLKVELFFNLNAVSCKQNNVKREGSGQTCPSSVFTLKKNIEK